jgi:hypothetical protein
MIAMVEGARRQKPPNEVALTVLLAALTLIFLLGVRDAAAVRCLRGRRVVDAGADRAAGLPDPDHDRRAAERDRHQRHRPADPAQT